MSAGQSHTLYFPVYFVHIVWLVVDSHESVESSDLQLDIVVIMLLIVPMSRLICKYFQTLTTCCLQQSPGGMLILLHECSNSCSVLHEMKPIIFASNNIHGWTLFHYPFLPHALSCIVMVQCGWLGWCWWTYSALHMSNIGGQMYSILRKLKAKIESNGNFKF